MRNVPLLYVLTFTIAGALLGALAGAATFWIGERHYVPAGTAHYERLGQ